MANLLVLKCDCCGGNLKQSLYESRKYVCEYCGTQYKKDGLYDVIKVERFQNPVRTLKSRIEYSMEDVACMGAQASEFAVRSLSRNLADTLTDFMRIETEVDPVNRKCIMTAKVRVVEDNYLF